MARLFIGCRVRIVRCLSWPEISGQEGRIVRSGIVGYGKFKGKPGWVVVPDSWGSCRAPYRAFNGATSLCTFPPYIEPVIPEGHQPAELTVEELLPFLKTREVV